MLIPTHGAAPTRPPGPEILHLSGQTMGTTWSARIVTPSGASPDLPKAAIESELDRVVGLFSHWDARSELARFNAAPPGFWAVSEPFWRILNAAMDFADDTDGAVDPTLGTLVDLWGFGPPGPRPLNGFGTGPSVPLEDEVQAAKSLSGWGLLRLNREARAVQQLGGVRLDLSGIAKGHAVDVISDRLFAMGLTHHLIEIGGELRGRGVKPDGLPWWADIEAPPGAPGPRTVAALFDLAMATSGDGVRSWEAYGERFSHTIDGRTGRPITNGVASVTVLADTAMKADAMATALTVMGPEDGPAYAQAVGLAALMLVREETGLREIVSPAFAAMAAAGT